VSRWFRLYADAMRNPKVMRLDDSAFRLWVKLLAVASENDGKIPPIDDLKLMLNTRLDHLSSRLDGLIRGGLIDALADGYTPHNWKKFQYKSDTSNERVAKHRAKSNVTVTPPDTDTDTDTESDKKDEIAKAIPSMRATEDCAAVVKSWNAMASANGLTACSKMTGKRRQACQARLRDDGLDAIQRAIEHIPKSQFLLGRTGNWSATINFLLKPDSITNILEGTYDDRSQANRNGNPPVHTGRRGKFDGFSDAIETGIFDGRSGAVAGSARQPDDAGTADILPLRITTGSRL
jgi:hypothetical protein